MASILRHKYFFLTLSLLLLMAAIIFSVANRGTPRVLSTNLQNLPLLIGGYQGVEDSFSQNVYNELDADFHLYRHYSTSDGFLLSLYIGYYGTAKGGRTGHNPYACLPGAGWGVLERGTLMVYPEYYPNGVEINYLVAGKDGLENLMLHWYQSDGDRVLATGLQQNIERFKGRVLRNRNDGAYIQVNSVIKPDGKTVVLNKAVKFVSQLMNFLPRNWPEER